ncbi:MAG: hypothetical protein ABII80_00130 [bacterium]
MGKVKKVVMDASQEAVVKEKAVSKKKSMVIWEELYSDLSPRVAKCLREARVKPEQLLVLTDGEIMAFEGLSENDLEEIRAKYTPDLSVEPSEKSSELPIPEETVEEPKEKKIKHPFRGGKAIKAAKSKVDRTKTYSLVDAVKLVKTTNITKFDATVSLHLNLTDKLSRVEVTFPHLAGASKRVAIASDELLAEIEKGKIDFDILLTTPAIMPKLAKLARILGPKGLMPSPKSGTVTPNPESKKKEFEAGKTVVKAEAKFPLMHVTIGKVSQKEEELVANLKAIIEAVKPKNISKAVLASTMSPGVKLQLT